MEGKVASPFSVSLRCIHLLKNKPEVSNDVFLNYLRGECGTIERRGGRGEKGVGAGAERETEGSCSTERERERKRERERD